MQQDRGKSESSCLCSFLSGAIARRDSCCVVGALSFWCCWNYPGSCPCLPACCEKLTARTRCQLTWRGASLSQLTAGPLLARLQAVAAGAGGQRDSGVAAFLFHAGAVCRGVLRDFWLGCFVLAN